MCEIVIIFRHHIARRCNKLCDISPRKYGKATDQFGNKYSNINVRRIFSRSSIKIPLHNEMHLLSIEFSNTLYTAFTEKGVRRASCHARALVWRLVAKSHSDQLSFIERVAASAFNSPWFPTINLPFSLNVLQSEYRAHICAFFAQPIASIWSIWSAIWGSYCGPFNDRRGK